MKIDNDIISAIQKKVNELGAGGQALLAGHASIHAANISRYLNGETKTISDDTWSRLRPHLDLPEDQYPLRGPVVHRVTVEEKLNLNDEEKQLLESYKEDKVFALIADKWKKLPENKKYGLLEDVLKILKGGGNADPGV